MHLGEQLYGGYADADFVVAIATTKGWRTAGFICAGVATDCQVGDLSGREQVVELSQPVVNVVLQPALGKQRGGCHHAVQGF